MSIAGIYRESQGLERLVANAGDSDQEMCLSQKPRVARNHPLRIAELPRGCASIDHRVP